MQQSKLKKSCSQCEPFASPLLLLAPGMICNAAFGAPPVIFTLPANASGAEIQKALDGLAARRRSASQRRNL